MIYRNMRPYPIEVSEVNTGIRHVIQPQALTPDLPESYQQLYYGTLKPVITESVKTIPTIKIQKNDHELFEGISSVSNELYEETEEEFVDGLQVLNEKKGRGRPKKSI